VEAEVEGGFDVEAEVEGETTTADPETEAEVEGATKPTEPETELDEDGGGSTDPVMEIELD